MRIASFIKSARKTKKRYFLIIAISISANCYIPYSFSHEKNNYSDIIHYEHLQYPVLHKKGMVVSQNKRATKIGIQILKQGGNAIDAAVGVGFALAVTLPRAGNIGGGGFMLIYFKKLNRTIAIDYATQTPKAITQNWSLKNDLPNKTKKKFSYQGVAVPGTVSGLWEAHQKFGKLPWHQVVEPAIKLAQQGVKLSADDSNAFIQRKDILIQDPEVARLFFKRNQEPYKAKEILKQPELAWSLEQIKNHGKKAFYQGALAEKIVQGIQNNGGLVTMQDFASYQSQVKNPLWTNYRGYQIAYTPPPSGGIVLASIMNLLENFPMKQLGIHAADSIRVLAEVLKLGHHDFHFVGTTSKWHTPLGLMKKQYARLRAKKIQTNNILKLDQIAAFSNLLDSQSSDTTHYSVADAQGNVVSNTYTLSDSFGAHVAPPGTGILLNNSMRNVTVPANTHAIRQKSREPTPMQRITSSMAPIIVFKQSKPWLATGSLGGNYITGVIAQLLVNLIDHRLNLAEATMQPRIYPRVGEKTLIEVETMMSLDTIRRLEKKGYLVKKAKAMGNTQSILIAQDVFHGMADTRRPGSTAMGID